MPSAADNRPLRFEEFYERVNQCVFLSATPSPYEIQQSTQVVEQIVRPTGLVDPEVIVKPTKGQIDDLIAQIRDRTERGDRVLVTTLTKKMAEDLTDYLLEMGLRVRYLHSNIDTIQRIEILRDLRLGEFDVLVGINLLREGLDLPEVSLVAILDADKEGFLRGETSLIQTIGRAARNVDGQVIMYADRMTDSMQRAISETHRRRAVQQAYNAEHGIDPQTIRKAITDILVMLGSRDGTAPVPGQDRRSRRRDRARSDLAELPHDELARLISTLEEEMREAAADLRFEYAAKLRDEISGSQGRAQGARAPLGAAGSGPGPSRPGARPLARGRDAGRPRPRATRRLVMRSLGRRLRSGPVSPVGGPGSVVEDDPRRPVPGEVVPRPVDQDHQPVAEADQEHQVDPQPGQPARRCLGDECRRAARPPPTAPDGRHDPVVVVAEWPGRLAGQPPADVDRGVAAALDGHLGQLGEGLAVAACRRGQVADDEHLGMAGKRQVGADRDGAAPALVARDQVRQRVGLHARGPDHGASRQEGPVVEADPFGRHLGQAEPEADLDALCPRVRRAACCEAGENPGSRWSVISTSTTRALVTSRWWKSLARLWPINSDRAPAISTPVGPPPTRTMVSATRVGRRIRRPRRPARRCAARGCAGAPRPGGS